ncbi:RidA family protein [candidate division GN15 bacterium]|nr:RidA family protein [candidate division GN15 bacterium]
MPRKQVSSGSPWEEPMGYCRAVRVGNRIVVSGTGPVTDDGSTASPGDPHGQALRCFEIIRQAIEDLGGALEYVVRTRMYVTDMAHAETIGQAHGEFFRTIKPASTMVGVTGLVRDDWFVEIEAECLIERETE